MKKILLVIFSMLSVIILASCGVVYRDYNDKELNEMAISDYGFTSILFFKVIDPETALEYTGESYKNSGVLYGIKDEEYTMLFVPKLTSKDAFLVDYEPIYDVVEIYDLLKTLENESGQLIFNDPSNDYGGLSISVSLYTSLSTKYQNLDFDSPIFYIISTDYQTFNVGRVNENYVIFDEDLNLMN